MRILQRRGDLVDFAYLLVATLLTVVRYSTQDISCEVVESKDFSSESVLDFKRENSNITDESELVQKFNDYLLHYFKDILKTTHSDPIVIAKDSLTEMLVKVSTP